MSRKLFDEDGEEVEVPTEEELKDLQTRAESAGKSEEFNKMTAEIRKTLDLKEDDDLLEAIKLAKESTNPNFKAMRSKISRYETFIKNKIKDAEFDDDGNIVDKSQKFSLEDVTKTVRETTLKTLAEKSLADKLAKYPESKRAVIESYYKKLSVGEEMTSENVDKYLGEAERLSEVPMARGEARIEGKEPQLSAEGAKFVESPRGKEAAEAIFGDEAFSKTNQANK